MKHLCFAITAALLLACTALSTEAQTPRLRVFTTLTNLALSNPADINNHTLIRGVGRLYYYDPASTNATNTLTIIAPTNGVGRWLEFPLLGAGTGTLGKLPLWLGTNTLGDSILTQTAGTNISIAGHLQVSTNLDVNGVTYVWPASQGGASTVLQNNGSGGLTWTAPSAGTTINPNDNYLPYRSNATTFLDSAFYRIPTNSFAYPDDIFAYGFGETNYFFRYDKAFLNLSIGSDAFKNLDQFWSGNNTAFGINAGRSASTTLNLALFGYNAGLSITTGDDNAAFGASSLDAVTVGVQNSAFGSASLGTATNSYNAAFGHASLFSTLSGTRLAAFGWNAGRTNSSGNDSVYFGYNSNPKASSDTNVVVIGSSVIGQGSNTAQIGTNGITVLYLNGTVGWFRGSGTPEAAVTAPIGSFFSREDGGASTSWYVKESGTGNTGWVAK